MKVLMKEAGLSKESLLFPGLCKNCFGSFVAHLTLAGVTS